MPTLIPWSISSNHSGAAPSRSEGEKSGKNMQIFWIGGKNWISFFCLIQLFSLSLPPFAYWTIDSFPSSALFIQIGKNGKKNVKKRECESIKSKWGKQTRNSTCQSPHPSTSSQLDASGACIDMYKMFSSYLNRKLRGGCLTEEEKKLDREWLNVKKMCGGFFHFLVSFHQRTTALSGEFQRELELCAEKRRKKIIWNVKNDDEKHWNGVNKKAVKKSCHVSMLIRVYPVTVSAHT